MYRSNVSVNQRPSFENRKTWSRDTLPHLGTCGAFTTTGNCGLQVGNIQICPSFRLGIPCWKIIKKILPSQSSFFPSCLECTVVGSGDFRVPSCFECGIGRDELHGIIELTCTLASKRYKWSRKIIPMSNGRYSGSISNGVDRINITVPGKSCRPIGI